MYSVVTFYILQYSGPDKNISSTEYKQIRSKASKTKHFLAVQLARYNEILAVRISANLSWLLKNVPWSEISQMLASGQVYNDMLTSMLKRTSFVTKPNNFLASSLTFVFHAAWKRSDYNCK